MLDELAKLTRTEFVAFMNSGVFTGFTEQEMAQANETDRGKMELFNEAQRLKAVAKRLNWRRGQ